MEEEEAKRRIGKYKIGDTPYFKGFKTKSALRTQIVDIFHKSGEIVILHPDGFEGVGDKRLKGKIYGTNFLIVTAKSLTK